MKTYKSIEAAMRALKLESKCYSMIEGQNERISAINCGKKQLHLYSIGSRYYINIKDDEGVGGGYFYNTTNIDMLYNTIYSFYNIIRLFE